MSNVDIRSITAGSRNHYIELVMRRMVYNRTPFKVQINSVIKTLSRAKSTLEFLKENSESPK